MDTNVKATFSYDVEVFKRKKWNLVKSFTDLLEADEFAKQIALRSFVKVRVIRKDVSFFNSYFMPDNNQEKSTMTTFLTLLSVLITAIIIGFGAVLFKLLNTIAI